MTGDRVVKLPVRLWSPGLQWEASRAGERVRSVAAGMADALDGIAATPDTRFLSASTTKLLTAILALQAAGRGELSLELPVADWLPDAPDSAGMTLSMLLAHRAGLANPNPMSWVHRPDDAEGFDEHGALFAALNRYPCTAPGARYRYSNLGYWLAGAVLERATGRSFAQLVAERLLVPLGLAATDMSVALPDPTVLARGHVRRFGPVHAMLRLLSPRLIAGGSGRWVRLAPLLMNGPAYGGVFARAEAYLRVGEDLLRPRPRLLTPGDRDALLDPHESEPGTANRFGLKIGRLNGHLHLGKPGGGPGFSSNIRIYPEVGLVSVWLANTLSFSERRIELRSDGLDRALI